MGSLWSSARSRADDADAALQIAEAERDTAIQRQLDADVEVATLRDELAAARQELGSIAPLDDTASLDAKIVELETEIGRLTANNADLTAFIDATEAAEAAEQVEPEAEANPTQSPSEPTFDPALAPEFSRYVGELLSSRSASSALGQAQSECFGAAVINSIGVDALGAGLNNSATTAANNVVVDAMNRATVTCNIDPSLIFG
jgi:chromosome segregation ATPase